MREIKIKKIKIENFKGIKKQEIAFNDRTSICSENGKGKTSIADAICWMFFNKNSNDASKFNVRPLDKNNEQIQDVVVYVQATLEIDGEEVEITKTQKRSVSAGRITNENGYLVNGYPKTEKEYNSLIADLAPESILKILMLPAFFTAMKWQDQRSQLMEIVESETDLELLEKFTGYDEIKDLIAEASPEDVIKKYTADKKEIEKEVQELPTRIDELESQFKDFDYPHAKEQLKEYEKILADLEYSKQKEMELQFEISGYKQRFEIEYDKKKQEIDRKKTFLANRLGEVEIRIKKQTITIQDIELFRNKLQKEIEALKKEYEEVKSRTFPKEKYVFDEKSTVCALCGRELPAEQIDDLKKKWEEKVKRSQKEFDQKKQDEVDYIKETGNAKFLKAKEEEEKLESYSATLSELNKERERTLKEISELEKELDKLEKPNIEEDKTYKELIEKQQCLVTKIKETEIPDVDELKATISNYGSAELRIKNLKARQKCASQNIADVEKILFLVDKFVRQKLEYISKSINDCFEMCDFKLFEKLNNGNIKETCQCIVNGVPYSDLNTAHKILVGLDIVKAFQKHFDLKTFILLDNAECINSYLIPDLNCQMIDFRVTEDKEITIK